MYKKFLRLALTGALLFQSGNICTFAHNKDEFDATGSSAKVDYCKNFPKNQYGKTVDLDCAFTQLMINQKASNGRSVGLVEHVGANGDHEIRIWNTDQIKGFVKQIEKWIKNRKKGSLKNEFLEDLLYAVNSFLRLDSPSTSLSKRIAAKWAVKAKCFKNYGIKPTDMNVWLEDFVKLSNFAPSTAARETTARDACGIFYPIRFICKKNLREKQDLEERAERAFYESLFKEKARQRREEEIKANVYADLLDQALEAILNKDYRGKDSLVANLDFSEDNYGAQTYFTDIGLEKKMCDEDFKPRVKNDNESENNREDL